MKIKNLIGLKGNSVRNQFQIVSDEGDYFQSYETMIAFIPKTLNKKIILDVNNWQSSRTTNKYRNLFLGMSTKEIEAEVKSGKIILEDLNKEEK